MIVVIIENSDKPREAEFMRGRDGCKLEFTSHEEANYFLEKNAEKGIAYKQYDGED